MLSALFDFTVKMLLCDFIDFNEMTKLWFIPVKYQKVLWLYFPLSFGFDYLSIGSFMKPNPTPRVCMVVPTKLDFYFEFYSL